MSIPSFPTVVVVAGASLFAASQSASAAIISFTQQFVWEFYVTNAGAAISVETFDSYSGFYPGSLTGSSGGVDWTATAAGGIFVGVAAGSPALSTNNVAPLTISFAGAPLRGVGGNFFGTDVNFNVVPAIVQLALDNGSSYVALIDSAASFAGFYSTDALITSITILAQRLSNGRQPSVCSHPGSWCACAPCCSWFRRIPTAPLSGSSSHSRPFQGATPAVEGGRLVPPKSSVLVRGCRADEEPVERPPGVSV